MYTNTFHKHWTCVDAHPCESSYVLCGVKYVQMPFRKHCKCVTPLFCGALYAELSEHWWQSKLIIFYFTLTFKCEIDLWATKIDTKSPHDEHILYVIKHIKAKTKIQSDQAFYKPNLTSELLTVALIFEEEINVKRDKIRDNGLHLRLFVLI